jgi:broad specificity phosphatase PhoE
MLASMNDAYESVANGDVVMVSHQMPIWITHRKVLAEPLAHDPRKRRCALSSITSFERHGSKWVEVDYRDPSFHLRSEAIDVGAV